MVLNWQRVGFKVNVKKKFFTQRAIKYWNKLLREVVDTLSL